jgi:error-prone DNA polymerase
MAAFCELGALSNFTFLDGASHPHELVAQARAFGMAAIGIADRNSVAGLVRGMVAAEKAGLGFVPGIRLGLEDGAEYLAWPSDRAAWGRLTRLLSEARMQGAKGEGRPRRAALVEACAGSVLAALPPPGLPDAGFARRLAADAAAMGRRLALPLFCAADHRARGIDQARLDALAALGRPLLAAGGVRYHDPARRRVADVLTAIRLGTTVPELGYAAEANAEAHLLPPEEAARRFARHPEAIAATARVAAACRFSLRHLTYEYPEEILDPGRSAQETLVARVTAALAEHWPEGPPGRVARQIAHELDLIATLNYAPYFLTVHEIVRFARGRGILCQGRGSAANSAVCYVLGITAVPPDKHDLLFERFISAARDEPPDIDVDFEHERREEVIQHIYDRYGRDRAAIAATLIRFRDRSAIREVGKAFGLPEAALAAVAKSVWGAGETPLVELAAAQGLDPADPRIRHAMEVAEEIQDFPRHLATHVGGFIITRGPLVETTLVVRAAMAGRTTLEWDKEDIEALGMLKVDVLGLGMLTCIRRAFDLVAGAGGPRLALKDVPQDDPATYAMLSRADSLGVFQVESRAQMNMLPRLRPREFYDLVIQVAIVRPGPIQGDMVHPYLRRRNGEEPADYPSEELRGVLGKTLGVPLFQEQAMRIAIVAAGFTPERADALRRAMATFRHTGTIGNFRRDFIGGMVGRGYAADFAERCFRQIEGFGTYGFPESHACSFAGLVYVSAWIKCHHPAAFAAALLNSQPMGFYAPAQIVRDAAAHGVAVRPVDVNCSGWDCSLEDAGAALRLGLNQVAGLASAAGAALLAARATAPFAGLEDLAARTALDRGSIGALARADAFGSLGTVRRAALWAAAGVEAARPLATARDAAAPLLPRETAGEETVLDYAATGLSLRRHPLALLRPALAARGAADTRAIAAARQGRFLKIAGLVLVRQRPGSAKGVVFFTTEDEWGTANLVLYPDIVARDRAAVVGARLVMAEGRVERTETPTVPILHLVVRRLHDWSEMLGQLHAAEEPSWSRLLAHADEVARPNGGDQRTRPPFPSSRDFR